MNKQGYQCKLKSCVCPYVFSGSCKFGQKQLTVYMISVRDEYKRTWGNSLGSGIIPRMTAKVEAKRAKVNENGPATKIACVSKSRIYKTYQNLCDVMLSL